MFGPLGTTAVALALIGASLAVPLMCGWSDLSTIRWWVIGASVLAFLWISFTIWWKEVQIREQCAFVCAPRQPRVLVVGADGTDDCWFPLQRDFHFKYTLICGPLRALARLEQVDLDPFDILVIKWAMKGMGGLEMLRRLREIGERLACLKELPVLILHDGSGDISVADRQKAVETGATLVDKTIGIPRLCLEIERVLEAGAR